MNEVTHAAPAEDFVTESSLARQFCALDLAVWPMQQQLARNLWSGWTRVKREGVTQHAFLLRVVAEMKKQGSKRSATGLWPYLYAGAALTAEFTPTGLQDGELIGKALDRLGLSPEVVQGHLDAGNLAEVVADSRAPTVTARITTDTRDALEQAATLARATLDTTAMSDPEVRAIMPRAFTNASPQVQGFLLRLGNGDVDLSKTYVVEAEEARDAVLKPAAAPVTLVSWGKLNAPCWLCSRTPAESGFPHEAHHVQAGSHETRPGDDTEVLWAFVCPRCHRPEAFGGVVTAHDSAHNLHFDGEKLHAYLRYFARCVRLYEHAIGAR